MNVLHFGLLYSGTTPYNLSDFKASKKLFPTTMLECWISGRLYALAGDADISGPAVVLARASANLLRPSHPSPVRITRVFSLLLVPAISKYTKDPDLFFLQPMEKLLPCKCLNLHAPTTNPSEQIEWSSDTNQIASESLKSTV